MKNFWFLLLMMSGLVLVSCGEDEDDGHIHEEDHYDAEIMIMSPAQDAEVTVGEVAHVHVEFSRPDNKIVHNVKVEVLGSDGSVIQTLIDEHTHQEGAYSFHSNDFTPGMHGAYTLKATSSSDDGSETVTAQNNFTAKHASTGSEYKVNIDIVKPGENTIIDVDTDMEVEVTYTHETHGEIIHNVLIDIVDSDGNQVAKLLEEHVHSDMPYTYSNAAAWKTTTPGTYTLRAMTTDFEGNNMQMQMREVTVQ